MVRQRRGRHFLNAQWATHCSKFTADGDYIEGPAPRPLDQFIVEVVDNGQIVAQTEDSETAILALKVTNPEAVIRIQTGKKILGKPRAVSPARRT